MTGFKNDSHHPVVRHTGDPDCEGAHAALLSALNNMGTPFLNSSEVLSQSQKGNLGEFISFHIGRAGVFAGHVKFADNAIQPLNRISGSGVDLMFVHFDPANEDNDLLYIQEVKTTGASALGYFSSLTGDYQKLFSTDLNRTLQNRINYIANKLELEQDNEAFAVRVQKLAAKKPHDCSRVRLVPTGVHSTSSADPVAKLLEVRTSIVAIGWPEHVIMPWAIGLSDLDARLLRLARGQS